MTVQVGCGAHLTNNRHAEQSIVGCGAHLTNNRHAEQSIVMLLLICGMTVLPVLNQTVSAQMSRSTH